MFVFPLLLLVAVAALAHHVVAGPSPVRHCSGHRRRSAVSPTSNALAILADRLARGEVSPDDYRAAVAVLRETPPPPAG